MIVLRLIYLKKKIEKILYFEIIYLNENKFCLEKKKNVILNFFSKN
jgi:hypothetical protein